MRPLMARRRRSLEQAGSPAAAARGTRKLRPSSPPVSQASCEARTAKARRDRQRDHGEEDRAHAQREQPDDEREQRRASGSAIASAERDRGPASARGIERDADAVAADAEEHRVGERDDAGIAEQQVVARHQHDEEADLRRGIRATASPGNRNGASASAEEDRRSARRQGPGCAADRRRAAASAGHRSPPDRGRAPATAGSAPSAGCWRRARASARGSRCSWPSAPPAARR